MSDAPNDQTPTPADAAPEAAGPRRRPRKPMALLIALLAVFAATIIFYGPTSSWSELNRRLVCAANLKAIGGAVAQYDGPLGSEPDLATIIASAGLDPSVLHCPNHPDAAPNYVVVWANVRPTKPLPNDAVIAYEPKENHAGEGGNILFADGHAAFLKGAAYDEAIAGVTP